MEEPPSRNLQKERTTQMKNHHRPTCASHNGDACNCIYGSKIRKLFGAAKTGPELRDEGAQLVEDHTPDDWKDRANAEINRMASLGFPFTAENVREVVGSPINHQNAMGAVFLNARRKGIITRIGYIQGKRTSAHARMLAQYKGVAK